MRALVVGLGHMGTFHRRVLRDLGYEVDAVDPDAGRGAEFRTIREAVVDHCDYDVAAVACPPEHLVDSAFQLAGVPMLVEKPFATSVRDGALLAAYLESKGAPVAVGFIERFNPAVRALRAAAGQGYRSVRTAHFTRYSDKPTDDLATDLLIHDVDLARFLGYTTPGRVVADHLTFDTRADQPEKVRRIDLTVAVLDGGASREEPLAVDLMAHDQSPLHALWHSFLANGPSTPRPADAVAALRYVREQHQMEYADVKDLAEHRTFEDPGPIALHTKRTRLD